jgi:hypothetical protein
LGAKVEKMFLTDLKSEQRRQLIDTQQVYAAWQEAAHQGRRRFAGSMRWVTRNRAEYLLHKIGESETSLGPRAEKTEQAYKAFISGRAANKERLTGLSQRLDEMAPVNRAMGLGRLPAVAARILRLCDEKGLLGRQLFVVGTNALFAYEALAGVHIDSGLIATTDIDLLHDTRRQLSLAVTEGLNNKGLLGLLQQVDRSFALTRATYRASNRDGYLVELIRPEPKNIMREKQAQTLTQQADDLAGAAITGLSWLVNAPKIEATALDERGYPVRLAAVDPRVYALHKLWLSDRKDREKLKATRDREQAEAAATIAVRYLNLSFDDPALTALPASLMAGAAKLKKSARKTGEAAETPNW